MSAELVVGLLVIFIVYIAGIFLFWIKSLRDTVNDVKEEVDVVKQVSLKKKRTLLQLVTRSNSKS